MEFRRDKYFSGKKKKVNFINDVVYNGFFPYFNTVNCKTYPF